MQYTYNIMEAAALWAGVELSEIRQRMEQADNEKAEVEYSNSLERARQHDLEDRAFWLERLNICDFQCALESTCPEWREIETEDGDRRLVLKCPHGFSQKPADNPPTARIVARPSATIRLVPLHGEFEDLPKFEQRLGWLRAALSAGDLAGTQEIVLARDLRKWLTENFPGEQPEFLFSNENTHRQMASEPDKLVYRAPGEVNKCAVGELITHTLDSERADLLVPIIEKLIKENASDKTSVIYPALRELANDCVPPFNGVGKELHNGKRQEVLRWTDSNGESKPMTRKTLDSRLRRRRNDA